MVLWPLLTLYCALQQRHSQPTPHNGPAHHSPECPCFPYTNCLFSMSAGPDFTNEETVALGG